jgi:hypothetical protein
MALTTALLFCAFLLFVGAVIFTSYTTRLIAAGLAVWVVSVLEPNSVHL